MPASHRERRVHGDRRRSSQDSFSSARSYSTRSSLTQEYFASSDVPQRRNPSRLYQRIKSGLKKSNPAAITLWVFHKIPSHNGLTARRVIKFLKQKLRVVDDHVRFGRSVGTMLRRAVEFGLLEKRGNRYFLIREIESIY